MKIHLASHFGMCFGVRDAIETTKTLASSSPTTILGELVHNSVVTNQLTSLGVQRTDLTSPEPADTKDVVITAHGASDRDRSHWKSLGHRVTDTTCPLVHRAHRALATLVAAGHHPVVIGQFGHVEVRGLTGDFPTTTIIETEDDISKIPQAKKLGIVSQTTQPIDRVRRIVSMIRSHHTNSEITFKDTVCQPTKDRQQALLDLCDISDLIIVVGGSNSNNTRQLVIKARAQGLRAHHVTAPSDLSPAWFRGAHNVGITAGTSTLPDTVHAVRDAILAIAGSPRSEPRQSRHPNPQTNSSRDHLEQPLAH